MSHSKIPYYNGLSWGLQEKKGSFLGGELRFLIKSNEGNNLYWFKIVFKKSMNVCD